jgi:hypothetical protein
MVIHSTGARCTLSAGYAGYAGGSWLGYGFLATLASTWVEEHVPEFPGSNQLSFCLPRTPTETSPGLVSLCK